MAAPSLTYTLTNGTSADASQVMQNYNDLLNGYIDGTKDLTFNDLTANGDVTIGSASGDDLVVNASLASSIPVKTDGAYDVGGVSTGLRYIYFGDGSGDTARVAAPTLGSDINLELPSSAGQLALRTEALAPLNIGLANATTTNANDSIKIQGAAATLSATNPLYIALPVVSSPGTYARFTATADVTLNLTGAHGGRGTYGDFTDIVWSVYAINDNGTLKWGVSQRPNLRSIVDTSTSTTQTSVNAYAKMLVNSALSAGTWPCVQVGYFLADFDDTGGAAEDLWAVQTGAGEIVVGQPVPDPSGECIVTTGAGHGSTNTRIRRIETSEVNTDKAVLPTHSATNGSSFTALEDGTYSISYTDRRTTSSEDIGISVNSNQLTTDIVSITATHRKAVHTTVADSYGTVVATVRMSSGDIARPHTNGNATTTAAYTRFSMRKVAHA